MEDLPTYDGRWVVAGLLSFVIAFVSFTWFVAVRVVPPPTFTGEHAAVLHPKPEVQAHLRSAWRSLLLTHFDDADKHARAFLEADDRRWEPWVIAAVASRGRGDSEDAWAQFDRGLKARATRYHGDLQVLLRAGGADWPNSEPGMRTWVNDHPDDLLARVAILHVAYGQAEDDFDILAAAPDVALSWWFAARGAQRRGDPKADDLIRQGLERHPNAKGLKRLQQF